MEFASQNNLRKTPDTTLDFVAAPELQTLTMAGAAQVATTEEDTVLAHAIAATVLVSLLFKKI